MDNSASNTPVKRVWQPGPVTAALHPVQTLWCLSFRPWARDNGLLWLPALLLGGVAVALGGLHGILREAWFASDMTVLQYLVIHVPLRCVRSTFIGPSCYGICALYFCERELITAALLAD